MLTKLRDILVARALKAKKTNVTVWRLKFSISIIVILRMISYRPTTQAGHDLGYISKKNVNMGNGV